MEQKVEFGNLAIPREQLYEGVSDMKPTVQQQKENNKNSQPIVPDSDEDNALTIYSKTKRNYRVIEAKTYSSTVWCKFPT
jgi:hypothetical protein